MEYKINRFAIIFIILVLFIGISIVMVVAQEETPPSPPTDQFGGGGGGGGGGSYTPAQFEKFSEPLKSSDGTIIGRIDGENFNSYMVWAERNGTVGNTTYTLTVEGELSSKLPDDRWLDIDFLEPGSSSLPPGMENGLVFAVVNVTKKPDGWSWKSGNPKCTLKISGSTQNFNPGDTYYLIRSGTSDYQMQKVTVDASGGQATIKFNPPGDSGIFTIMVPALATPAPTPEPTPEPTPTPTPVPENNWMWGFPIFIAMFAVGAIAGAVTLFIMTKVK
jgi:hypothetical protein